MKKLITFVGTGKYEEVTYIFKDDGYKTRFFVEAAAHWYRPDEILVMLTEDAAKNKNWEELEPVLLQKYKVTPVNIRDGKSEEELWENFQALTDCLNSGDSVVFDVTHSFRTIPILTLIAATYLRVAKSVRIEAVVYGAFEAKPRGSDEPRPVFDLTPFITLLDWVTATDKFMKTGDGRELAQLLNEAQNTVWKSRSVAKSELPTHMKKFGSTLESLSTALQLIRPQEVAEYSSILSGQLDRAEAEVERWAKPFTLLLEKTRSEYSAFTDFTLPAQRKLISWYAKQGYLVQAIALAREWIISMVCEKLSQKNYMEYSLREDITDALNSYSHKFIPAKESEPKEEKPPSERAKEFLEKFSTLENARSIADLWARIRDIRNDIAHCGFRESPGESQKMKVKIKKFIEELKAL